MIHRLKYGREMWLGRVLAGMLAGGLADRRLSGWHVDLLVPVPLHRRRERERGFNQSAVLAGELAGRTHLEMREVLERRRYTATQTQLDRRRRRQNLRDAFVLRKNADVTDLNILLVDDVLTTGSTLDACAGVLREAGAASVRALTVARG
jgi:ComF family protein